MATINFVGRPVIAEAWQNDIATVIEQELSDTAIVYPPHQQKQFTISHYELERLPEVSADAVLDLKVALDEERARRESAEIEVETTKVLVRTGGILLGLLVNDALSRDRRAISKMFQSVLGVSIRPTEKYHNILIGHRFNHTENPGRVIHTITDQAMPKAIHLGQIGIGLMYTTEI